MVKRTGHSSYYVEKGMAAMGKTPSQMGIQGDYKICGGAFPIWLENAPCCPIAVVGCYSGSSVDDHHLAVTTVKDYLKKMQRDSEPQHSEPAPTIPSMSPPRQRETMWAEERAPSVLSRDLGYRSDYRDSYREDDEHELAH